MRNRIAFVALIGLAAGCATPMQRALIDQDIPRVKALLDSGVGINEPIGHVVVGSGEAPTPLDYAAELGEDDMVRYLLESGADWTIKDSTDRTPFEQAVAMRNPSTAKILKEWELRHAAAGSAAAAPAASAAAPPSGVLTQADVERMVAAAIAARAKPKDAAIRSDADAPTYRLPERPDDFALVVGVEKYQSLPDATYARRDAQAVRDHLLALGFPSRNVVLLVDAQATKTSWIKYLDAWLPESVDENSTVFVYYSGHGAPDAATGQAYLVPVEGDPQYLAVSALPVAQLYQKLGALKARRVIVALDSCFSGAGGRSVLPRGARPLVSRVDAGRLDPRGRIVALTASGADEISGTIDAEGHGAFTYFLLKGLNGAAAAPGGAISLQNLYDYLTPRVADSARTQNRDQTPALLPEGSALARERLR